MDDLLRRAEHEARAVPDAEVDLLTTKEFAAIVRAPESTVRYWRMIGYGPSGMRVGRRVLYPRVEVERWLRALRGATA